jgi:hypothetical protein
MRTWSRLALLLAAVVGCNPPPEGPSVLYTADAQSTDNPFPDARLLTAQGLVLRKDWYKPFLPAKAQTGAMRSFLATWAEDAKAVQGMGNFGSVLLRTSEPLDPASLKGTFSRLVKDAVGYRVLERDVPVELSTVAYEGTARTPPADFTPFLVVRPTLPMTAAGQELVRPAAFHLETGASETIKLAAVALGIDEREVLLALPQKTSRLQPSLSKLVEFATQSYQPVVTIPPKGNVPDGSGDRPVGAYVAGDADFSPFLDKLQHFSWSTPADAVGKVVIGSFLAHDLRTAAGIWDPALLAAPETSPKVELAFLVVVPKGPKPAGGYRAVIGAHGIGGRNTVRNGDTSSYCLDVGQLLAQKGLACIGIDAPSQGTRGSPVNFFALEHLPVTRENFREMIFDQLQLGTAIAKLDLDGDGQGDFSPELGYFGNSLGAIMGASYVSLDPRVKYALLNVPGGGLSNILGSPEIRDRIGLLLASKTLIPFESAEYYGLFPLFRAIAQVFMDEGDPVNIGQAFPADRALLIQEAVNDLTIPNTATASLAAAMQAQEITSPASGTAPLRLLFIADARTYLPPERVPQFNSHNLIWDAAPLRRQAQVFLESHGTEFVVE